MQKALNPDVITTLQLSPTEHSLVALKELYFAYNRDESHMTQAHTRYWAQEYKRLAAMTLILLEKVVNKEP